MPGENKAKLYKGKTKYVDKWLQVPRHQTEKVDSWIGAWSFWHLLKIRKWHWAPYYSFWPMLIALPQCHNSGRCYGHGLDSNTYLLAVKLKPIPSAYPWAAGPERSASGCPSPKDSRTWPHAGRDEADCLECARGAGSLLVAACGHCVVTLNNATLCLLWDGLRYQCEMINHHTKSKNRALKISYLDYHGKMPPHSDIHCSWTTLVFWT